MSSGRPIVVGIDGSDHARWAVEWAAREAASRDVPLRVVHAFVWPLLRIPPVFVSLGPPGGLRGHATDLVSEAVQLVRSIAPEIDVRTATETAFPQELLAAESRSASYVVVGSRGLGAVGRVLVGSVTTELVVRAHCPVAVIGQRPPEPAAGPVVVGVDGSAHSERALETAIDLATHWGAVLRVIHAVPAVVRHGERAAVERMLTPWLDKVTELVSEVAIVPGHPGGVLVEMSETARAVVVGSRGDGGFAGMLHGSVSQAVVHHAHCPIVVVPPAVN